VIAVSLLWSRQALRPSSSARGYRRKGHPKAIGAVARHLAEATFGVLSKQEPYHEPKVSTVSSTGG